MASILNDKPNVVLPGKVDGCNHVFARRNIDGIANKIAQKARTVGCSKGITALVGEISLHHRGGWFETKPPDQYSVHLASLACDIALGPRDMSLTGVAAQSSWIWGQHRPQHHRWVRGKGHQLARSQLGDPQRCCSMRPRKMKWASSHLQASSGIEIQTQLPSRREPQPLLAKPSWWGWKERWKCGYACRSIGRFYCYYMDKADIPRFENGKPLRLLACKPVGDVPQCV